MVSGEWSEKRWALYTSAARAPAGGGSKKGLIIGLVAFVLLGGGGAAAYIIDHHLKDLLLGTNPLKDHTSPHSSRSWCFLTRSLTPSKDFRKLRKRLQD